MLEAEIRVGLREGPPEGNWATHEPDGTATLTLRGDLDEIKATARKLQETAHIRHQP